MEGLECATLCEIIMEKPSCRMSCHLRPASYRPKRRGEDGGCLIAHAVLSLIEAQRVKRIFRVPVYKIFRENAIGGQSPSSAEELWDLILAAILIHDIGKLTDEYQSGGKVRHHEVSAIVARKALKAVKNDYVALNLSYAILFHHEAIDWRMVNRGFLTISYLDEVLSSIHNIRYHIDDGRTMMFKDSLTSLLGILVHNGILSDKAFETIDRILDASLHALRENAGKFLKASMELDREKLMDLRYQVPALAVYRLIFLSDNRAASARASYWMRHLNEINWYDLEGVMRQIEQKLSRAHYYIGLSSIQ